MSNFDILVGQRSPLTTQQLMESNDPFKYGRIWHRICARYAAAELGSKYTNKSQILRRGESIMEDIEVDIADQLHRNDSDYDENAIYQLY